MAYSRCLCCISAVLSMWVICRLFCCVLIYCCITVLFLLHLKTVSFSTLVMLCIHVPPLFCEVNLMHLTQTLSPSVSLPPSLIFPPPLHLFSVTSLISHCLLTGSESLVHKHGWRDKFTTKRAHDKRNHPATLFL